MPGERSPGPHEWEGWKIATGWEAGAKEAESVARGLLEEVPKFTSRA